MKSAKPASRPPLAAPIADAPTASDRGAHAREQLLRHATRIFAAKGFAGAATREICDAAGTNVAAIHYYFGDKEGLYRAVIGAPIDEVIDQFAPLDDPALPFADGIRAVLAPFLEMAFNDDPHGLDVTRLHLRETIEPTPIFREIVAAQIAPKHHAVAQFVARHCGLRNADTEIHQLTLALFAMASDYCISREFIKMLAPDVFDRPRARQRILDRLVDFSVALLAQERQRRGLPPGLPAIATASMPRGPKASVAVVQRGAAAASQAAPTTASKNAVSAMPASTSPRTATRGLPKPKSVRAQPSDAIRSRQRS